MRAQLHSGRTALVTGGGRGIGLELTRQLAAEGATVIITGREARHLEAAAETHPGQVVPFAADLTDAGDRDRLVAFVQAHHPDLSLLINNAASQTETDFIGGDTDRLRGIARSEIALNFEAPADLTIALLPLLAQRDQASIVNVTTGLAIAPKAAAPVYCATKAGLRSFTRALRYQCADRAGKIRVHEAVMALVDTDMTKGRGRGKIAPEQAAREILSGIRAGKEEIWIGKTRMLRLINRVSPAVAARILR